MKLILLPPQQEKLDPLMLDEATFTELVDGQKEVGWRQLFNKIDGFSPTLAKEVVARAAETGLWEAYQQVIDRFDVAHVSPQLLMDGDEPIAASAMVLHQFPHASSQAFDTMSDALAAYYEAVTLKENIASERRTLTQALTKTGESAPAEIRWVARRSRTGREIGGLSHSGRVAFSPIYTLSPADRNR